MFSCICWNIYDCFKRNNRKKANLAQFLDITNMRKVFYLVLSLVIASCTSNKELQEKLAFIDVTKEYPEKKIELTDIAGVSYLQLNSKTDDYLYKGSIDYVTENNIIVIDRSQNSVLFFSKEGNPKSHFNRRGQGPEEYSDAASLMYDEAMMRCLFRPTLAIILWSIHHWVNSKGK